MLRNEAAATTCCFLIKWRPSEAAVSYLGIVAHQKGVGRWTHFFFLQSTPVDCVSLSMMKSICCMEHGIVGVVVFSIKQPATRLCDSVEKAHWRCNLTTFLSRYVCRVHLALWLSRKKRNNTFDKITVWKNWVGNNCLVIFFNLNAENVTCFKFKSWLSNVF